MLLQSAVLVASIKQADVLEPFAIAVVHNVILSLPTEIMWLLLVDLLVIMMVSVDY